ncbi:MAG TPA: ATP-dependent zinc metalloprotease FtsH [bacterium]|nr:ATP-dependent zinc metalloprotease FtsH [bacterium]
MNPGPRRVVEIIGTLIIAAAALAIIVHESGQPPTAISYTEFLDLVRQGAIASVTLQNDTASGILPDGRRFLTYLPSGDPIYPGLFKDKDVTVDVRPQPRVTLSSLLPFALPVLFMLLLWPRQPRQQGEHPALRFGRSRARLFVGSTVGVTFGDVAGVDEAKEELEEIIEFLRHPNKFQALGAKIPRGVLLVGPPGSGKTLLAKAIAGEAWVPFFSISGSEFVEMFVGVGASRVRDLFDQAKKSAPCLVFIDEIDAVGRQRGAGLGGGHDEREQTLNQLLVEMDGFDPNSGIIVIAATNRPDILDPALLRPGRFDRRIVVDNPDTKGRRAILDVHVRGKPIGDDANLDVLAKRTPGFSGADLANMVNEAALLAARRGKKRVGMSEFDEAIERVIAGPQRKSRILSPKERELTAFHEGGHALLGKLLPQANPPHKVTILPRGMALGYTLPLPQEDKYTITRSEILANITAILGGRVAEEIVFGEITTGAANDFEKATELARKMVTEFGMSDKLGPLTLGTKHGPVFLGRDLVESRNYSDEIAYEIDKEVRRIIDECYSRARQVLTDHQEVLDRIAKALLERESLTGDDLDALISTRSFASQTPAAAA